MKFKLLLLIILSILIVYLIYDSAPPTNPYILSIYDKTTLPESNYNNIIKNALQDTKITYDTTLSKYNFEIENLKYYLITNKYNIKQLIRKSDLIIIHLGKDEILDNNSYNSNVTREILVDLEIIFKNLRKITSKNIIYIPPEGISNTLNKALTKISNEYNIVYLNSNENISSKLLSYLKELNYI